jgi:hypothetical protein
MEVVNHNLQTPEQVPKLFHVTSIHVLEIANLSDFFFDHVIISTIFNDIHYSNYTHYFLDRADKPI